MNTLGDLVEGAPLGPLSPNREVDDLLAATTRSAPPQAARAIADRPVMRDLLAGIAAGSPYLWGLCQADPARLSRLLHSDPETVLDEALVRARSACRATSDAAAVKQALRLLKQEAALLLGLVDLGEVWGVPAVTQALTRVADCAISEAVRWLLAEAARAGRFRPGDPADPELGSGLVVLAMGKQGAGELNYSSDVDLIIFYDPDIAPLKPGLEPAQFFVRLAQALVRLLTERTPDGYVFRTDLRLRPDPGATQVAISLPAAFAYYESVGQNWERAALIKARPCAGDIQAGEGFLRDVASFIWRRHLDFAAIADVHAMKRQINAHRGHGVIAVGGHDLKVGRGGIREIEFFVQTQQLIAGGRNPALRGRQTLAMLAALAHEGWITREACEELTKAYCLLRRLEHRLQMMQDEQTHALPPEGAGLERFARFAGFEDAQALASMLFASLTTVQSHYARLFEASPALSSEKGSLVFTGKADDVDTLESLLRLGYADPHAAVERVRGWHFGRYRAMRSTRAREDLTELTPALLQAFAGSGRPDETLQAFDGLLSRMPSGFQFFTILRSNPRLLDLLALILGTAPRLAEMLAIRPHALDGLLDPGSSLPDSQVEAAARLTSALASVPGHEGRLDAARVWVRETKVMAGTRLLAQEIDALHLGRITSDTAAAAVAVLLDLVQDEMAAAHGRPAGGRVALIAMGKLGGREMTATSDLDLILVYDHDPEASESTGPRPLATPVWFARLTQRLIAALSAPTAQGVMFDVDMRLRPSGRKGPVAVHVEGFAAYQRKEAWTWEHMALTRARPIAGDESLCLRVTELIREVLVAPSEAAKIRGDVAEMRRRLLADKPARDAWDLKMVSGGLIDIEFAAQLLQLLHAARCPDILSTNTGDALDRLRDHAVLSVEDHEALRPAWDFTTTLSQIARLCLGRDLDPAGAGAAATQMIAREAGQPDLSTLQATLRWHQAQVRRVSEKLVGEVF